MRTRKDPGTRTRNRVNSKDLKKKLEADEEVWVLMIQQSPSVRTAARKVYKQVIADERPVPYFVNHSGTENFLSVHKSVLEKLVKIN
ncbi:hypothetical protein SAMN05192553_102154 [Cyclobacterium xiamenense]|uniref:Uncharacterized protein n=1 Tax=Cyclobacterium xiamenense TaxID=1297121 RepID=A0A1H6VLL6_9BACT|nr:hypothetical protein [Cyclobacterium xiamenense]SEJ05528.1 hypothetical protein SAMN05192553_102154 [Cyclobacterium xiamenense]